jgi:hypothetical protein
VREEDIPKLKKWCDEVLSAEWDKMHLLAKLDAADLNVRLQKLEKENSK